MAPVHFQPGAPSGALCFLSFFLFQGPRTMCTVGCTAFRRRLPFNCRRLLANRWQLAASLETPSTRSGFFIYLVLSLQSFSFEESTSSAPPSAGECQSVSQVALGGGHAS